jgi:hypothetical protein
VKNFAKLVLFFSISFAGILLFVSLVRLLQEWTNSAAFFPPASGSSVFFPGNLLRCIGNSLPAAFYISILLSLSYARRQQMLYPMVFVTILVLVVALSAGAFLGVNSVKKMGGGTISLEKPPEDLAKPGLILVQGNSLNSTQMVFLEDPYKQGGARAVSVRGQPLYYLSNGSPVTPVRLAFAEEKGLVFGSIDADLQRSSRVFSVWFDAGLLPYAVYAGSLAVLLLSLGCLLNISYWSLANLFFGALAFRGALLLESFLNQPNIQGLLVSYVGKIVPSSWLSLINPAVFGLLGLLILLYSGLVYLARGRKRNG